MTVLGSSTFRGGHIGEGMLVDFVTVGALLALDAEGGPWDSFKALQGDILLAMEAHSVGFVFDTGQGAADEPQHPRIAIQIAHRNLALAHLLHFVESVGRLLDNDFVPVAQ
jgi:hypothetical protein